MSGLRGMSAGEKRTRDGLCRHCRQAPAEYGRSSCRYCMNQRREFQRRERASASEPLWREIKESKPLKNWFPSKAQLEARKKRQRLRALRAKIQKEMGKKT